jgi:iron complex transport system permease protein
MSRRPAAPASRRGRLLAGLTVCLAALAVACAASLCFGSRAVSPGDVWGGLTSVDPGDIAQVAVRERVPRTILGVLVGACLGLAGALLQGVTRNPLADPGILGLNSGAALFVVFAIAVLHIDAPASYVWFAFAGAAAAGVLVYAIGSLGREGATPLKLTLAGAAATAAMSSVTSAVLLVRTDVLNVFRFWQVGSLGRADVDVMVQVLPFVGAGVLLAAGTARGLDVLSMGDDVAAALGQRTSLIRALGALAAVLLCGTATALAGPIAFLGMAVAHLARMVTGPDYRWILPYAAVLGAVLLLFADVLGRLLARPQDLEAGLMCAFLGAPVLVAIVRRQKVREL